MVWMLETCPGFVFECARCTHCQGFCTLNVWQGHSRVPAIEKTISPACRCMLGSTIPRHIARVSNRVEPANLWRSSNFPEICMNSLLSSGYFVCGAPPLVLPWFDVNLHMTTDISCAFSDLHYRIVPRFNPIWKAWSSGPLCFFLHSTLMHTLTPGLKAGSISHRNVW